MVDWKKQFMEAGGVAAFSKPLSPDFTGISAKISVGYHMLLKQFDRTKNRSFSNQKSALATLLAVRREQFTFSIMDLYQNLLELMLFRCVAALLSLRSFQVPLLRTSIPGTLLFFLQAFMVSWEIYRDACEVNACRAKDHKLKYHEEGKKPTCDHRSSSSICQQIDYHS